MKNFMIRSASAVVFASLLLGSLFFNYVAFAAVIFVFTLIALWEYATIMEKIELSISKIGYTLGGAVLYAAFVTDRWMHSKFILLISVVLLVFFVAYEIWNNKGNIQRLVYKIFGYLYIAVPFGLMMYLVSDEQGMYKPVWMVLLFAIVWCNDTFAYIVGVLIGRNRMCPRVSPKKSWEGFAGGMASVLGIAFMVTFSGFAILYGFMPIEKAIFMCLSVAIAGVLGDLLESLLKRSVQIKDSGNSIPGHGGVLDRFDAVLLAVPVMYLFLM